MLNCPFCGAPETERLEIEGARFVIFPCMFTPRVEAGLSDAEVAERLGRLRGPAGAGYFRGTCDALHVYVTKGDGARILTEGVPVREAHDAP